MNQREIKPYNSQELSNLYGISYKTFLTWLKPIRKELGKQVARMWNPKQVKQMFDHFDPPTVNE